MTSTLEVLKDWHSALFFIHLKWHHTHVSGKPLLSGKVGRHLGTSTQGHLAAATVSFTNDKTKCGCHPLWQFYLLLKKNFSVLGKLQLSFKQLLCIFDTLKLSLKTSNPLRVSADGLGYTECKNAIFGHSINSPFR